MAIVFQRAVSAIGQSVTIDIGAAGNNRLLIVQYGDESIATDDAAMGGTPSVDGKNFTLRLAKSNPDGIGNAQEIWTHDEASLGSSNGSLTVSGGGVDAGSGIRVALWYGVDDGVPTDTAFDDTTIGSGPSANIDVPANGLIVAGAGNGSTGGTASWTAPLIERIDGATNPPSSAILGLAEAIETSAQTNKAYTVVVGGGTLRSTLLLLAFAEASAGGPDQTANGSPSVTKFTAAGTGEAIRTANGSPSITPVEAAGDVTIIRTADGSPSINPLEATGVAYHGAPNQTADGSPSVTKFTASSDAFIWPRVYLNATKTLAGAVEMTVQSVDADGTSITFDDDVGFPTGSLFLGVENRNNGDVGWIPVTVFVNGPTVIFGSFGA